MYHTKTCDILKETTQQLQMTNSRVLHIPGIWLPNQLYFVLCI